MAKLMEGVSEKVPMRSAVLGAFALFLQFLGYFSIAAYIYEHSRAAGAVMFFSLSFFIIIGTAHHVKTALMEYVFLKLDRDERGKNLLSGVHRICYYADCCHRNRNRRLPRLGGYFHRFTGIYPSVSLPDYRHAAYFRYDIHACLDVFTVGRSVSSSDKHSGLRRYTF